MADFELIITDSGTLGLPVDQRLKYSENALLSRNARGVLYAISGQSFVVMLPSQPDDVATERWFNRTLDLSRALQSQRGRHALPTLALARHEVFACLVVVMVAPLGSVAATLGQLQRNQQLLGAERMVLRVMIDLLDTLTELQNAQETLALRTLDIVQVADESGSAVPTLIPWGSYLPASGVVALNASQEVGRWLHRLLLGFNAQPPFSPFDDTAWQGRSLPYQAQGVISVGLRYLLTALFHSPADQRFLRQGSVSFEALRDALHEWYTLTLTLGSVIDQQTPQSLSRYSAALPPSYQFSAEGVEAQAIWLDLWLRIHQTTDAPEALSSQEITRSHALLRAKVEHNAEAQAQDAINRALAETSTAQALAILQDQQERVRALAVARDITLWGLWQHLGRWQRLLGLNTPREVIRHIGTTLHRVALEDSAPSLDILHNTLLELNAADVLAEVQLRQAAQAYRHKEAWTQHSAHFAGMLATLPRYLQLPAPARHDLLVQPYTLQGQLVSGLEEVLAQMSEALAGGNPDVALALGEYARALPLPVIQRQSADEQLEPLNALAAFLRHTSKGVPDFSEGMRLLDSAPVQQHPGLRQQLEQLLLDIAQQAMQQVATAAESRDWGSVRRAAAAHHLLTQRQTRHLVEQLRVTHLQQVRSLEQSALLSTYEQIYQTYRELFLIARQQPLWHSINGDATPQQAQDQARHIMAKLNEALALGLPMDDLIASDEHSRQRWQQLISDAMSALQRVEHVTQDVQQLRQRLQGDGGFGAQLQALNASLEALREQIDGGTSSSPGILSQIQGLRAQLAEMERSQASMVEQSKREIRVTQDDIQRQLEAQDIALQRHTQQINSSSNLIQDARDRLAALEQRLESARQHESQLLCAYLDAMPQPQRLDSIDSVLDTVDGLVYAMRRCPVEAYDAGCHDAWTTQFNALRQRFDALTKGRLSWRDRRNLKANLRSILALFSEVEQEAQNKAAANCHILTADLRP